MHTALTRLRLPALLAALALTASACWVSYGFNGDNTRNAVWESQISSTTAADLNEVWRHDGVDGVTSTPAVYLGSVYFGAWDGTVRSVNAATGAQNWSTQLTSGSGAGVMVDASPTVYGDQVFTGDGEGGFHALDRTTGAVDWSVQLDSHPQTRIFGSPVVVEGRVIVGVASYELAIPKPDYTFRGAVVALDPASGAELWRTYMTDDDAESGAGVSVWSTAAVDTDRQMIYIGTGNTYEEPAAPRSDALVALDYTTGDIVWLRQFTEGDVYTIFGSPPQGPDADIGAAPNLFVIDGQDVVGVGDKAGVYAALDRDTGDTVWARQLTAGSHLGGVMMTAAYDADAGSDGVIYVSSNVMVNVGDYTDAANSSQTFALDASDGSIIWEVTVPASSFGALTLANGVLFQPTTPGTLYALDTADGSVLWSEDLGAELGGGVSVFNGTVFAPYGFWFFGSPANPLGGVVAFQPDS